jgi:CRISPR/Cas system-associated exonuclease Cas4 (RecB family)
MGDREKLTGSQGVVQWDGRLAAKEVSAECRGWEWKEPGGGVLAVWVL